MSGVIILLALWAWRDEFVKLASDCIAEGIRKASDGESGRG